MKSKCRTMDGVGRWMLVRRFAFAVATIFVLGASPAMGQASPPTTGLKLWLAADAGVTLDGSGKVSSWADQSGNSNNATQATAGNRPTVTANALNGNPVIHFNGASSQYLALPNLMSGATSGEVFAVLRSASTTAAAGLWNLGSDGWSWYSYLDGRIEGDFGTTGGQWEGVPSQSILSYQIYEAATQAGLYQSWINGAPLFKSTTNTVAFTTAPLIGVNGHGYYLTGDIAEILIYDHTLSATERADIVTYLNSRYAIISPPPEPTGLFAVQTSPTQNLISWDWQSGGMPVSYFVERKTGTGGAYSQIGVVDTRTTFVDDTVSASQEYYYRVYASNIVGVSDYSEDTAVAQLMAEGGSVPTSGLKFWVMADSLLGGPVSYMTDYSGFGNDALQPTISNSPTLLPNASHGKPTVHFEGASSQYLALPNLMSGATAGEVLTVLRATSATGSRGLWTFGAYPWTWYTGDGAIQTSFGTSNDLRDGIPPGDVTKFHTLDVSTQAGLYQTSFDGALMFESVTNTVGFVTTPRIGLNGYGYYFNGDIAEVLIFNRVLSEAERNGLRTYLSQKYQLSSPPPTPTQLQAAALNAGTAMLTWNEATTNSAVSFGIWRQQDGGAWTQVATVSGRTFYFDAGLIGSGSYAYKVEAITDSGASALTGATTLNRQLPQVSTPPTSGMRLWLMADSLVSSPVGVMPDYSGNDNDALQGTYANRPTLVSNVVNGRPAVHFDAASSQFLQLPNVMNGATAGEVFAVLRATATAGNSGLWTFGAWPWTWYYPGGGIQGSFGTSYDLREGLPPDDVTKFHVYQVSSQAGLYESRLDGKLFFKTTNNSVGFSSSPVIGLNGYGYYFSGDIAEILVYDRPLDVAERRSVWQYLGVKYLLGGLDTDGDGLTNAQEGTYSSNPLNPDTNGDGLFDGVSVSLGINPVTANSLFPNPNGPLPPNPPASAPGTMVITLTSPAGATLLP